MFCFKFIFIYLNTDSISILKKIGQFLLAQQVAACSLMSIPIRSKLLAYVLIKIFFEKQTLYFIFQIFLNSFDSFFKAV